MSSPVGNQNYLLDILWRQHYRALVPPQGGCTMSHQNAERVAKFFDSEQFLFAKKPVTAELGPNDTVFFKDADDIVFACVPRSLYLEMLSLHFEGYPPEDPRRLSAERIWQK